MIDNDIPICNIGGRGLLKQLKAPIFFDLENLKDSRDTPVQFNKTFELLKGNLEDLFNGICAKDTPTIETVVCIISGLMDVIEDGMPEYYFRSDFIAECDDFLKEMEGTPDSDTALYSKENSSAGV